ncbi:MAG: hypothetical protein KF833_15395 [Verrucomicrobiae bacterium]|nr:hypothetical protein [Verrucomicrobiae bacterium]
MKISKNSGFLAAGLLLAAPGAQAQVEINISGAVAFRDTAYHAIRALYGANLASENTSDQFNVPVTVNKSAALKATWTGTIPQLFGQQAVTVRAFYNGAVAGVQDLTQNRNVSFLASSTQGDVTQVLLQSDIAFSSIFQQATEFTEPVLEDRLFGATPIHLVKSTSAPAGITNITAHQIRTLAANGSVPASFLTGNPADTQTVYFVNRDPTAGQRVTLFLNAGFNGEPISYRLDPEGSGNYVVDVGQAPTFIPGRNPNQIAQALATSAQPAISYLISADSYNLLNAGQNVIAYDGFKSFAGTFNNTSNDYSPIINGQYSLWVYEHLLNRTTASQNVRSFLGALVAAIENELETSFSTIPSSRLRVERQADGAPVAPLE